MEIQRNNISFTSRCPQIRDAQWVVHTVNTEFPHFSLTKMQPMCAKFLQKNEYCKQLPKTFTEIDDIISSIPQVYSTFHDTSFLGKMLLHLDILRKPQEEQKTINTAIKIKENIFKLWNFRRGYNNSYNDENKYLKDLLTQMTNEKLGNCFEDSILSELVLKLNGIKNATLATLYKRDKSGHRSIIDHVICIFSPDDKKVQAGELSAKDIVVDTWLGIADFAPNAILKYKTIGRKFFNIGKDDAIDIRPRDSLHLTKADIEEFREKFPQLVFQNKARNFMQAK